MTAPRPRRPAFGPQYGISPDMPETAPSWSDVAAQLSRSRNYWVTTTRPDGRPHAAPVWGVWLGDELLFSTDPRSVKARSIAARPELVVHLESGDDVVIVEGLATLLAHTDPRVEGFVAAYEPKYDYTFEQPMPEDFAIYAVTPTKVLSWAEQDFVESAFSWQFD